MYEASAVYTPRFNEIDFVDEYLSKHESPEDIELYFCGPPLMNQAVLKMADDWGIPDENVRFDDFGG